MILHMGLHMLEGCPGIVQLYQLALPTLEERARVFAPLKTREQLGAGYAGNLMGTHELSVPSACQTQFTANWVPGANAGPCSWHVEHAFVSNGCEWASMQQLALDSCFECLQTQQVLERLAASMHSTWTVEAVMKTLCHRQCASCVRQHTQRWHCAFVGA